MTDLPTSFDSRKNWPHCRTIPIIQDQSTCNSCWAVASASVISDRMCTYKVNENVQVSAANLMSCCKNCSVTAGLCSSGYPARAYQYWIDEGLVSRGEFGSCGTCDPYPVPPRCLQNETSLEKIYTSRKIKLVSRNLLIKHSIYLISF